MSKQHKIKTMRRLTRGRQNSEERICYSTRTIFDLWSIKVCADILRNNKFMQVYMVDFWRSVIIHQPSTIDNIKLSFT